MTDYTIGSTFDIKFTTRAFASGVPTALAGTPAVSIYADNDTDELGPATVAAPADGITLTVDFDGVAGLNNVRVVATTGNGYASGSTYHVVVSAGTVDGVSVVGEVVGHFTLDLVENAVWDAALTGSSHNNPSSAGKRLRQIAPTASFEGTINGTPADASNIVLDGSASTTVDFYRPGLIIVESSFGIQFARIEAYAADRTVTVATAFQTTPEDGDAVTIIPWASVRISDVDDDALTAAALNADAVTEIQAGLSSHSAADVWSAAERLLTAGTNIALAKGVGVTGFNDLSAAEVNSEVDTAISDAALASAADLAAVKERTDNLPDDPADQSLVIAATDAIVAAIAALNNVSSADLDAALASYAAGTLSLPSQGAPSATPTRDYALALLFKLSRNKKEQTSGEFRLYDDAGLTVDQKSAVSDVAGTATRDKLISGA